MTQSRWETSSGAVDSTQQTHSSTRMGEPKDPVIHGQWCNPRTVVHGGCWAKGSFLSLIQWSIPYADVLLVYFLIEINYVIQFYHAFTESVLTLKCCPNFYLKHIYFHVLYVPRLFVSGFFFKVNLHFSNKNVH